MSNFTKISGQIKVFTDIPFVANFIVSSKKLRLLLLAIKRTICDNFVNYVMFNFHCCITHGQTLQYLTRFLIKNNHWFVLRYFWTHYNIFNKLHVYKYFSFHHWFPWILTHTIWECVKMILQFFSKIVLPSLTTRHFIYIM